MNDEVGFICWYFVVFDFDDFDGGVGFVMYGDG